MGDPAKQNVEDIKNKFIEEGERKNWLKMSALCSQLNVGEDGLVKIAPFCELTGGPCAFETCDVRK